MSLTTKQIVFFFLFSLSWLILLLLGESYLSYVLLGGMSLFFFLFVSEIEWQKISNHRWLIIWWLLLLFGVGLSSFFSINLPLSLYSFTRFIFIFLVFWFFLLIKKSFVSSQQIIKLLLIISGVVVLISVVFQFFPNLANLLPGMNLLHASYGHNHLAALLLLIIPLSWWLASDYVKAGRSRWWWLLPVVFNLGLLYSFGRMAVAIGLIQFLFIYWQLKKSDFFTNTLLNFIFKVLVGLFSIVILGNIFFSVANLVNPEFSCPVPSLEKQLCKSVETEFRPEYWRWSREIMRNNFWWGSGPGTFGIAAKKYVLNPFSSSSHAHNEYLESLAETGIIGGSLFIGLMLSLLYLAWRRSWQRKRWGWKRAAFLGVVAIYVDIFFDFDWDFIGIAGITLILLALLVENKDFKLIKRNLLSLFKMVYFSLVFVLILIAGLYLKTDALIKANNPQRAFNLFPYFHWHWKIFASDAGLSGLQRQKLLKIYQYYPDIYSDLVTLTTDLGEKQQLQEKWAQLDPWQLVYGDLASYYIDHQDWQQAHEKIDAAFDFFQLVETHTDDYRFDATRKIELAEQMLMLGDYLYKAGQYERAGHYYTQARWANSLILGLHEPVFISSSLSNLVKDPAQQILFFRQIGKIKNGIFLGQFLEAYTDAYLKTAAVMVGGGHINQIDEIAAEIMSLEPQKSNLIWEQLLLPLINSDDSSDKNNQQISSQKAFLIWQLLLENGFNMSNHYQIILIEKLITNGYIEEAKEITDSMTNWDQVILADRQKIISKLQAQVDLAVKNHNYAMGFDILEIMSIIQVRNYWLAVQPANLAVLVDDYDLAKKLYQQCLDFASSYGHDDCYFGLESLKNNQPNPDRYFQVSQIIRGEAVWQDFAD